MWSPRSMQATCFDFGAGRHTIAIRRLREEGSAEKLPRFQPAAICDRPLMGDAAEVGTADDASGGIQHDGDDRAGRRCDGPAEAAPAGRRLGAARKLNFYLSLRLEVFLRGLRIRLRPHKAVLVRRWHVQELKAIALGDQRTN